MGESKDRELRFSQCDVGRKGRGQCGVGSGGVESEARGNEENLGHLSKPRHTQKGERVHN